MAFWSSQENGLLVKPRDPQNHCSVPSTFHREVETLRTSSSPSNYSMAFWSSQESVTETTETNRAEGFAMQTRTRNANTRVNTKKRPFSVWENKSRIRLEGKRFRWLDSLPSSTA